MSKFKSFKEGDIVICNQDTDNVELIVNKIMPDGVMVTPYWGSDYKDPYLISPKYLEIFVDAPAVYAQLKAALDMIAIQKALIEKMGVDLVTRDEVIKQAIHYHDAEDYEVMDSWCMAYTKGDGQAMANIDLYVKHCMVDEFTDEEWVAEKQDMIQEMYP